MNKVEEKRQWQLFDEDDDLELLADGNKRLREHKKIQGEDMNEVVVANLNWPQVNQ